MPRILDGFVRFLERLGGKTIEIAETPIRKLPSKELTIKERLELLKKMREEIEKEKEKEEEELIEESVEWREKEIKEPFSQRLAKGVLKYFRGPVESLSGSIRGLEEDLYRANIMMSKELYVALMLAVGLISGVFAFLFGIIIEMPIDMSLLIGVAGFLLGFMYMRFYPKSVWRRRVEEVERALPYVLRHMASLLNAGIGLAETMVSVAKSDYGVISEEFRMMVQEMHKGSSFEDALASFEEKMKSDMVSRVVKQILRALKFGGNLADILYKMADEFSFEYRIKLMDYVQKINGISFVYMFMTVVMPTLLIVVIIAGSIFAKRLIIDMAGLAILFLFGFPALSLIIIVMIKRAEPR
ncbi:type II secretion system F family protein [Pyrococcus abyssi]|uniref:Type II secretion system protein GspF domain-containing protein n=1 Tax=Pyrococcus abyssi (strain GE5 / Orsay) TaxID=272844 RepID=Q9UYW8_PYRAB|nr:type II secretion system F family protein [Pyrococcus abyssi]CAB50294.1 Hypothetical protein PAB1458 [Pyrococcus abyssi GE5]CCE70832.1 TPA: hypothetical protein PAB1458 [Pyrococcus abyssi GE5]